MKNVKIANGQGFWGDSVDAPINLIKYGNIDYLTLDYLAEVTISIMQRQKQKNPNLGYATDFVDLIEKSIVDLKSNNIKVIANAGGINPEACRKAILEVSKKKNINIKVAVIAGDDIFKNIDKLVLQGESFKNFYDNRSFDLVKDRIYSANVYIDSFSIAEALQLGADIVLCGRVSDPGLVVGPCIYEFGWDRTQVDMLAAATVAGHILECGAQCTGGNHSDWKNIQGFDNIGYPIVSFYESGYFDILKPMKTGGSINKFTVSEQILYELGNPQQYISPDVCVDFTSFSLEEINHDVVRVQGVKGFAPTDTFKVSMSYFDGYKASGSITVSGPDALEKSKLASEIVWKKLENLGLDFDKTSTEYLGLSSCFKSTYKMPDIVNEIVLRLGVKSYCKKSVIRFTKELSPLITSGPPGITGFSEGRPRVRDIVAYWPALIKKENVSTSVTIK